MNAYEPIQSEIDAIKKFKEMGRAAVEARLDELNKASDSRRNAAMLNMLSSRTYDTSTAAIDHLSLAELDERAQLQLGHILCVDTASEARMRVLMRCAARGNKAAIAELNKYGEQA